MKKHITYILFLLIVICSCTDKEAVETYVPNNTKSLIKINLPGLKSKLLTWDFITANLWGKSTPENTPNIDLSIDINRPIYAYSTQDYTKTKIVLPIDDIIKFEKSIGSHALTKQMNLDSFKYTTIKIYGTEVYVSWITDVAILSREKPNTTIFKKNGKPTFLPFIKSENDITAKIYTPFCKHEIIFNTNFNNGAINTKFNKGIKNNLELNTSRLLTTPKLNKKTLSLSANLPLIKLREWSPILLPKLQQYGVLFTEQLDSIVPYLDGSVNFQFSELTVHGTATPLTYVTFGLKSKTDFVNLLTTDFLLDTASANYTDSEAFQFITFSDHSITFSNFKQEMSDLPVSTALSLQLEKKALYNDLFFVFRLFIGRDALDDLPIETIKFDTQANEGDLNIHFTNKKKNSLQSILDFIAIERDEI